MDVSAAYCSSYVVTTATAVAICPRLPNTHAHTHNCLLFVCARVAQNQESPLEAPLSAEAAYIVEQIVYPSDDRDPNLLRAIVFGSVGPVVLRMLVA